MSITTILKIALGLMATILVIWAVTEPKKNVSGPTNVICETTKGPIEVVVMPEWSPLGARRFLDLVDGGFYSHLPMFRCVERFVCQFGAAPPRQLAKSYSAFPDDPQKPELRNFKAGYLSFAGFAPNSRNVHVFLALDAVASLGAQPWETPFGYVTEESMRTTVSKISTAYGDMPPFGKGPDPQKIEAGDGENYLRNNFPSLDWFVSCARKK